MIDATCLTAAGEVAGPGQAGNLGDPWPSEQKRRGKERGRRGKGSFLTHPLIDPVPEETALVGTWERHKEGQADS